MAHVAIGQNSVLNVYANIECTDGQQVIFQSDSARAAYFNNHRVAQFTGMSYVYHDGIVKLEATPGTMVNANYISFNNPSFESKPIYARITDWKYVNNKTVALTYEVDWFQTFMFDFTAQSSQISREHLSETDWAAAVANPWRADIMELNQDEGIVLNPFDYDPAEYKKFAPGSKNTLMYAAIAIADTSISYKASDTNDVNTRLATFYDNIIENIHEADVAGLARMKMDGSYSGEAEFNVPRASHIIFIAYNDTINGSWAGDNVVANTNYYPKIAYGTNTVQAFMSLLTAAGLTNQILGVTALTLSQIKELAGIERKWLFKDIDLPTATDPKMKRYPFSYLEVMAPSGTETTYVYEGWKGNTPTMRTYTAYDLSCRTLVPIDYFGTGLNYRERFDTSPLLQLSYTTDNFLTYLSSAYQSSASRYTPMGRLSNAVSAGVAAAGLGLDVAAMGLGVGGAVSAGGSIAHTAAASAINAAQQGAVSLQTASAMASSGIAAGQGYAANAATGSVLNNISSASDNASQLFSSVVGDKNSMVASGLRGGTGVLRGDVGNLTDLVTSRAEHPGSAYVAGCSPSIIGGLVSNEYMYRYQKVTDATVSLFEAYFAAYGYKTGRIGIPRVCNYINGSGSMPHWASIDGKSCTYVKTTGMKIIAPLKPAADYIRAVFDAGCRFVKG